MQIFVKMHHGAKMLFQILSKNMKISLVSDFTGGKERENLTWWIYLHGILQKYTGGCDNQRFSLGTQS